jgi:hypothetical protein
VVTGGDCPPVRLEFADDPMMWVSHETIYQSLFVQRRGELRRELHRCLRTGRAQCRPRSRLESRGNIPDMVFTLFVPVKIQRVSPCHAGHTGTTSGMPSAPTVAICAQLDSRVVSAFTSSSSTLPPIGRLRPRDALCRRMNQPNSLLRVRRGG